ncbi:MAG TPA: response regulator, partial [Polyangiaceae bacterium]|nr:response regulator [Polyangiaceae bacterium]
MSGVAAPREDDAGRMGGARGEFVGSLPRRVEMLRSSLSTLEQLPSDPDRQNGLLRRLHALGSASRVLGFASVAEALSEAEKGIRGALTGGKLLPLADVSRTLDLLPALVAGSPSETRAPAGPRSFPISVLVFGPESIAEGIAEGQGVNVECERTEDPARARELARIIGPDVAVIDADRRGARELVELFAQDPQIEPVPVLVIGSFEAGDSAAPYVELGAARVLPKPVTPEGLRRAIDELHDRAMRPRPPRQPLGQLSVSALSERIAEEVRRGLVDAVEGGAQMLPVGFGEGADVMAAVWGAVARVRELVTLRSQGSVRFQAIGPEGAVPLAPWGAQERRAGERAAPGPRAGEGVSLQGRRVLVADDDPAVVWFMGSLLKAVGVEVLEAHNGRQALEIALERWPDVVISDVLMPELDGFSLCHEIKRDVAVRDTPVILLSWKEDLLQRLRELGADADGYLRKEAAASAVVERVREVLRPRARVEQRIEAGGEVRGRLDGLTARMLLEAVCRSRHNARISVRDAVYLWELSVREGRLRAATRSSASGDFARGPTVMAGLLGVSAGRFVVEPESTAARTEFEGPLVDTLREPIARARAALRAVSA